MQEAAPACRGFEIERHEMEREILGYEEEDCNCDHIGGREICAEDARDMGLTAGAIVGPP